MELTDRADLRPLELEGEEIDETSDGTEITPDYTEARGVSDGAIEEWQQLHPGEAEEARQSRPRLRPPLRGRCSMTQCSNTCSSTRGSTCHRSSLAPFVPIAFVV